MRFLVGLSLVALVLVKNRLHVKEGFVEVLGIVGGVRVNRRNVWWDITLVIDVLPVAMQCVSNRYQ